MWSTRPGGAEGAEGGGVVEDGEVIWVVVCGIAAAAVASTEMGDTSGIVVVVGECS